MVDLWIMDDSMIKRPGAGTLCLPSRQDASSPAAVFFCILLHVWGGGGGAQWLVWGIVAMKSSPEQIVALVEL